ncbi:jg1602 [Pararge aegeria aegeria]|uniref:Jg1602 protein n=1 Tax=Pararge aegeria aegeria TaxID=348720 RepID=A0A8S4S073_9NEOP|nr:jg1602 [Pararge aegeria aegeria]
MKAFLIIIMVCNTLAHLPETQSPNVGTVLFTPSDLKKKDWSKSNIALLQARKYLQNVLPSSQFISTINEDYLINLLTYFENSYLAVKREIKNPSLRNMMDVALSDVLGGYLKMWVLPITKYAYYGGTVSLDNSLKIFEAYEDIKRSLKTDGRGWHSPNENLLNTVAINIAPLPKFKKSMANPCNQLAYYEKTDSGMKIPLPFINWNISPPTMFVPLANQSIVPLSSPNSSSTLLNYYSVADNCMKMYQSPASDDFNDRFQTWLKSDVAPHLNDDKLYAAFEGILSLMNATKRFYDERLKANVELLRDPMKVTSKKFLVIALILIIELIWCIPTIIYIVRSGKKKRQQKKKPKSPRGGTPNFIKKAFSNKKKKEKRCCPPPPPPPKPKSKPKPKYCCQATTEGEGLFPFSNSQNMASSNTMFKSDFSYYDVMTSVNEKASSRIIFPEFNTTQTLIDNYNAKHYTQSRDTTIKRNKQKMQELKLLNNETHSKNRDMKNVIEYSQETINLLDIDSSACKCSIKGNRKITCLTCLKGKKNFEICKVIQNKSNPKRETTKTETLPEIQMRTSNETHTIQVNNKEDSALNLDQPMLRILIERPETSIKLGFTNYKEGISGANMKASKIPRAVKADKETKNTVSKSNDSDIVDSQCNCEIIRTKGLVITGKALDDSAIKHSSIENKKLNLTF